MSAARYSKHERVNLGLLGAKISQGSNGLLPHDRIREGANYDASLVLR